MKNLFMRNNTYQFRVVIPDYTTIYFPQKKLLIKSLETSDKQNAIKYSEGSIKHLLNSGVSIR